MVHVLLINEVIGTSLMIEAHAKSDIKYKHVNNEVMGQVEGTSSLAGLKGVEKLQGPIHLCRASIQQ